MDEASTIDLIRPYVLVALVLTFAGILVWVLWPGRRKKFKEHAEIPFKERDKEKRD